MRLGLIADAHGHLQAFEAGLQLLERSGADEIIFLGDAVGYIPDLGVVRALRRLGILCIRGNHEAMLDDPPAANEAIYKLGRARQMLDDIDYEFIRTWPSSISLVSKYVTDVMLMHGSPLDTVFGYVYQDSDFSILGRPPNSITVMANTHRPMIVKDQANALYLNPGSCGLPRDAGALGSVGLLDLTDGTARVLRYDLAGAARRTIARYPEIHPVVVNLFSRPAPADLVGELCSVIP